MDKNRYPLGRAGTGADAHYPYLPVGTVIPESSCTFPYRHPSVSPYTRGHVLVAPIIYSKLTSNPIPNPISLPSCSRPLLAAAAAATHRTRAWPAGSGAHEQERHAGYCGCSSVAPARAAVVQRKRASLLVPPRGSKPQGTFRFVLACKAKSDMNLSML
jgi:hypothetical protein